MICSLMRRLSSLRSLYAEVLFVLVQCNIEVGDSERK